MRVVRFAVDSGQGRLAHLLRLAGFDTHWSSPDPLGEPVDELLRVARDEDRVLLSHDETLLSRARPGRSHRLGPGGPEESLREVLRAFDLEGQVREGRGYFSRCTGCNHPLLPVQGHHVVDRVPGDVLLSHTEFFLCSRCERVFWKGDYYRRMKRWLSSLA